MLTEILQASAGTGKTYQIVDKGLNAGSGTPGDYSFLRRTVFLSFSNAAAEEIKSRLYKRLAPPAGLDFLSSLAVIESRVYTIHAFSFELARIFRYELGLPADAQFPADRNASVWGECVDNYFRSDWDLASLKKALNFQPGGVEDTLLETLYRLSNKVSLREFIKKHGQKIFFLSELKLVGAKFPETAPRRDLAAIEKQLDEMSLMDTSSGSLKAKTDSPIAALGNVLNAAVPALVETRPALEAVIAHIGRHVYRPYMFSEGIFDFDALVYFVLKILQDYKANGGMAAFQRRLDEEGFGFDRLFIDEAQDCDILMNYFIGFFLGDNCTVKTTIVGDAKQSIYRWRNAYPEEFLKMCEEAKVHGKCKPLVETRRIKNSNTLDFINNFVDAVQTRFTVDGVQYFDYTEAADKLLPPPSTPANPWPKTAEELGVKYAVVSDKTALNKDELKQFVAGPGRTGVVFRSRSSFRHSRVGDLLGLELQYRLAELFEEEKEFGGSDSSFSPDEIADIDPDYYLLKTLLWCFTAANRDEVAAVLLLSRKGLQLSEAMWPEHFQGVDSQEKFLLAAKKVYGEILGLYYARPECTVTETIYDLLNRKNLWPHFFRPECTLKPERAARMLNHALAALYVYETSGGDFSHAGGGELEARFAAAKIPYESSIPYENDLDSLSFIEAVTIHSAKGLTYDKVVIIADFNKLLTVKEDGREGKDEFPYLFTADFKKIITPDQELEIDYFPYLGRIPAAYMQYGKLRLPGIGRLYDETLKRVKAEKANLLYVAATRTKEKLMFIDVGNPKKTTDLEELLAGLQVPAKIKVTKLTTADWAPKRRSPRILEARPLLGLPGAFRFLGVRSYIKGEWEFAASFQISAAAAKFVSDNSLNMSVGDCVHQLVAELLQAPPTAQDYEARIKSSLLANLDEAGRRAAAILLSPASKEKLMPFLSGAARKLPELRLWGLAPEGKQLLSGVADAVLVTDTEVKILEHKTIFGASAGQHELGEKQVKVYGAILKRLAGDRIISGEVVELKA